jgi:hypothetical protein
MKFCSTSRSDDECSSCPVANLWDNGFNETAASRTSREPFFDSRIKTKIHTGITAILQGSERVDCPCIESVRHGGQATVLVTP